MGQEPNPAEMPLEPSDFPEEVQVAFFMFSLLPDHWEGMSGTYMGKYWDGVDYFFKVYEIEDPKTTLYIMKLYESELVSHKAAKAEQARKDEEERIEAATEKFENLKSQANKVMEEMRDPEFKIIPCHEITGSLNQLQQMNQRLFFFR